MKVIWYLLICWYCAVLSGWTVLSPSFLRNRWARLAVLVAMFLLWGGPLLLFAGDLAQSGGAPVILILLAPPLLLSPFIATTIMLFLRPNRPGGPAPGPEPRKFRTPEAAESAGDYAAAVRLYEKKLRRNPDDPDLNFALGSCLERLGRFREAAAAFEAAVRLYRSEGQKVEAALRGAHAYRKMSESPRAITLLRATLATLKNPMQRALIEQQLEARLPGSTTRRKLPTIPPPDEGGSITTRT